MSARPVKEDGDLLLLGSAQGVPMEVACRQWQCMARREPNSPLQCAHLNPTGRQQNEGAAAAAAEPASAAAAPAEGAVAAAAPAGGKVPAVSALAPSPAWKGAGQGSKKRRT